MFEEIHLDPHQRSLRHVNCLQIAQTFSIVKFTNLRTWSVTFGTFTCMNTSDLNLLRIISNETGKKWMASIHQASSTSQIYPFNTRNFQWRKDFAQTGMVKIA